MLRLCQRIYNLLDELKEESGKTGKVYLLVAHNGIAGRCTPIFMI